MIQRLFARGARLVIGSKPKHIDKPAQTVELQMVWPRLRLAQPPTWTLPASYSLRTYQPGDESEFFDLMDKAGYPGWNTTIFDTWLQKIVPEGLVFAIHQSSGRIVATAMGCHNPSPLHPFGATLSCVAAHPEHQGNKLGYVVSAAVTLRLLRAGYQEIYMQTDDWRLAAIKTYLKLGWVPFLFQADMPDRWKAVCESLGWPYTPQAWPAVRSEYR